MVPWVAGMTATHDCLPLPASARYAQCVPGAAARPAL